MKIDSEILIKIENASSKYDLDAIVSAIISTRLKDLKDKKIDSLSLNLELKNTVLNALQGKIYDLILSKAKLCELYYLGLAGLFDNYVVIKDNEKLKHFYNLGKGALFKSKNDDENLMLLELMSVAFMFDNKPVEFCKNYLKSLCKINLYSPLAIRHSEFLLDGGFHLLGFDEDLFFSTIREIVRDFINIGDSIIRRSTLNWFLHCFWNIEILFNNHRWLELEEGLINFLHYLIDSDKDLSNIDEVLYLQFFIYHICGTRYTNTDDWKKFNKNVSLKTSKYYAQYAKIKKLVPPETKKEKRPINIGILKDRLVDNSPFRVEFSLILELLMNDKFNQKAKITIYNMGLLEKSIDDINCIKMLEKLGIKVINLDEINKAGFYNSHLQKALSLREQIIKNKTDILISPNNGYGISDFVLSTRSAGLQVFYSHSNFAYNIANIDLRMTHISALKPYIFHNNFEFIGIGVRMDDRFYNPKISPKLIENELAKLDDICNLRNIQNGIKNKVILGSIGRLTKIDEEQYLRVVLEMLSNNQNAIYLACGSGNMTSIANKLQNIIKTRSLNENLLNRFIFMDFVNSAIYGHIIEIFLDSFFMPHGESKLEFIAKGGIALSYSPIKKEERKNQIQEDLKINKKIFDEVCSELRLSKNTIYDNFLSFDFLAFSIDEYREKLQKLINLNNDQKLKLKQKQEVTRQVYLRLRARLGVNAILSIIDGF